LDFCCAVSNLLLYNNLLTDHQLLMVADACH